MLYRLFEQGGTFFMTPILLLFIIGALLFIKELLQKNNREKTIKLLSSLGAFVFVWGLCGQVLGLIEGFDAMSDITGSVAPSMLYGGLKFTFLPTLFGMVSFLFIRVYIFLLQWINVKA